MLKFISNLFRKSEKAPILFAARGGSHFMGEVPPIVPTVEIAHLSLAAILAKFPADLRGCIEQMPDAAVTVTLPVPTILKQLPSCSVKMSLASLYRQAPSGVFKAGSLEEKRMVEVPLPEIFKRVRPELLQRRKDQRPCAMPEEGFALFGDKANPHAVALTLPETVEMPTALPAPVVASPEEGTLNLPETEGGKLAPPAGLAAAVASSPRLKMPLPGAGEQPNRAGSHSPPGASSHELRIAAPAAPQPEGPPLILPISELSTGWPEPIRGEVAALNGATISLPSSEVSAGLARGRVAFPWGQLRDWIVPIPPGLSAADPGTELALPLRVLAPAFLKHTKGATESRKRVAVGEDIPALFQDAGKEPSAPAQPPEPAAVAPADSLQALASPEAVAATEPAAAQPQPSPPVTPVQPACSQTINELFGLPDKSSWSPMDIVENVSKLPGISGAVVAMQEGLLVAHRLPEHMNGETFAAFLPQIFARLNQYSAEMKLGEVNALTIDAQGVPCQMHRKGEVLFAALGRAGEPLPFHALELCAAQIKN